MSQQHFTQEYAIERDDIASNANALSDILVPRYAVAVSVLMLDAMSLLTQNKSSFISQTTLQTTNPQSIIMSEEPLQLSQQDGFGYYPARLGDLLNDGRYEIIGKLGWGQHSSTWLVADVKYARIPL